MTVIINFDNGDVEAFESEQVTLNAADKTVIAYYKQDGAEMECKLDTIHSIKVDGIFIWLKEIE